MPYELRAKGRAVQTFDAEDEAVAGARREQGMARGSRPQGRLLTPSVRCDRHGHGRSRPNRIMTLFRRLSDLWEPNGG